MSKQMKVFYDTEFWERGPSKPIQLISIGMVREDGKEYYAVLDDFDLRGVLADDWLRDNVMSSIPHQDIPFLGPSLVPGPEVKSRKQVATDIKEFVADIWPSFWAWYCAYDHVVMCQLFGRMVDLPKNFPMMTCDIRQIQKMMRVRPDEMPEQEEGKHNALADAKHNLKMYKYLEERWYNERDTIEL